MEQAQQQNDHILRAVFAKHADHVLMLSQGKYVGMLSSLDSYLKENKQVKLSDIFTLCTKYYKEVGEHDHDPEELIKRITDKLGCSEEIALQCISVNDLSDVVEEAAVALVGHYTGKHPAAGECNEWLTELKDMLLEEGGLGNHQATLLVKRFAKSIQDTVASFDPPKRPSLSIVR